MSFIEVPGLSMGLRGHMRLIGLTSPMSLIPRFAQVQPVAPDQPTSPADGLYDIRPPFFYLHSWLWLWIALGIFISIRRWTVPAR